MGSDPVGARALCLVARCARYLFGALQVDARLALRLLQPRRRPARRAQLALGRLALGLQLALEPGQAPAQLLGVGVGARRRLVLVEPGVLHRVVPRAEEVHHDVRVRPLLVAQPLALGRRRPRQRRPAEHLGDDLRRRQVGPRRRVVRGVRLLVLVIEVVVEVLALRAVRQAALFSLLGRAFLLLRLEPGRLHGLAPLAEQLQHRVRARSQRRAGGVEGRLVPVALARGDPAVGVPAPDRADHPLPGP